MLRGIFEPSQMTMQLSLLHQILVGICIHMVSDVMAQLGLEAVALAWLPRAQA